MFRDDNAAKTILSIRLSGVNGAELSKMLSAVSGVAAWQATTRKTAADMNDVFIMLTKAGCPPDCSSRCWRDGASIALEECSYRSGERLARQR